MANQATYDDANLILKLYELRREEKLRDAREWFALEFFPQSMDDFKGVQVPGSKENTYFRMVTSYWDMAASFVTSGVLDAQLFLQSGGEMLFIWAKMGDFVETFRQNAGSPEYLSNIEKVIGMAPGAADRVAAVKKMIARMRENLTQSAKG
jgi:hypothetical protein